MRIRTSLRWWGAIGGLSLALSCTPGSGNDDDDAAPQPRQCLEHCAQTADCNTDFECRGARCVYTGAVSTPQCTDDSSCTPILSGWLELTTCDSSTACVYGVCVVVAGQGHCAMPPPCTGLTEVVEWPGLDGNPVSACGRTGYRCSSGQCWKPCADGDCGGSTPICGDDGRCRCEGSSCDGNLGGTVCLPDGHCGCQAGTDCPADTADTCFSGICGCGSAAICTDPTVHTSTTWVCEVP
ncbi:MAG: hypothetical protein ABIJ09_07145 [Pseudomonadota bacterium]